MPAIFISYRRDDSEGEAGRLFADLAKQFGESSVFMDVVAIEVGRDFRKAIDESVATCGVLLALIGKNWLNATNEAGERRLDDPSDFVRLETASALKRDIPVVPVLVHGASMPRPEQLPDDLRNLAYRNGCELTHARWGTDLQVLLGALRPYVHAGKPPIPPVLRRKRPWVMLSAALGAVLVVALAAYLIFYAPQVTVPYVTGVSLSDATSQLQAVHLLVGRKTLQQDTEKASDTVLSQFPKPSTRVKSGTAVDLTIAVPQFAGTWELFELIQNDGSKTTAKPGQFVRFIQNGTSVITGNQEVPIKAGTVTVQSMLAQDGTRAATRQQANSILTKTFSIEGGILVSRSIFEIRGHPTDHQEGRYRRVP